MHSSLDLELLHGIASSLAAELVLALMDAISIHRFKSSSAFRAMVWELDWWTPLRLVRSHLATFHISSFDDRRFVRWLLQSCAIVAALSRNLVFSHPCTSSCLTFSSRFPTLDVQLPRPGSIGKATHISLVGDVVKRARDSNCEEDREPGSTGSPLEVSVTVHLHLCGRSQNMNIVGALSQIGSVRLYLTNAGSKARPVKVLVHGDAIDSVSGELRTVVTTASHLELMNSCVGRVGIERVVLFTPSMPIAVAVADVRDSMPRPVCSDITWWQTRASCRLSS
jgi:hypothetical protein